MYINPTSDIKHSIELIILKIPVFLFGNLFGVEGFYNVFPQKIKITISVLCLISILLFFKLNKDILKLQSSKFLLLATIISLVLVSFVAVLDMRLGIYSSIFSAGLLAIILQSLYKLSKSTPIKQIFLYLLVFSHVFIASIQWIGVGLRDWQQGVNSFSKLESLSDNYPYNDIFIFNYPSPIDAYYFPFAKEHNKSNIYILNNNLSNFSLSTPSSNEVLLTSEQGLIFIESAIGAIKKVIPIKSGIYARAAFNGLLPRGFEFKQGDIFSKNAYSANVLDINQSGLIDSLKFSFNSKSKYLFFIWSSENKTFDKINIDKLYAENITVPVINY